MVGQRVAQVNVGGKAGGEVTVQDVVVGAANGYVVGRRTETVNCQTLRRHGLGVRVIASGGTVVAGGDCDRNALRRRLFPQILNVLVAGGSLCGFATAEADIEDVGLVVIEGAKNGKEQPGVKVCVGGGVEDDAGAGGDASGDFCVEVCLDGIAIFAGVTAVDHDRGGVGGQPEGGTIIGVLGYVDVGVAGYSDGDAGAIICSAGGIGVEDGGRVIDGGRVRRAEEDVVSAGGVSDGVGGSHGVLLRIVDAARTADVLRLRLEAIQRGKAGDDGSQGAGDLWIGCVSPVLLSVDDVAVERGVKGALNLANRAGKLNGHAPLGNLAHSESVTCEPGPDRLEIGVADAKAFAELLWAQELMVVRRVRILH